RQRQRGRGHGRRGAGLHAPLRGLRRRRHRGHRRRHRRVAKVTVRALPYDFPEVLVGTAEYEDGPTGCTLLCCEAGAACAVDVRGLRTVSLADGWGEVDGVLVTGGSTWGLDAAAGVIHRLSEERGGSVGFDDIPALPTAAVYDFTGRDNSIFPDPELGLAA